LTSQKKSYTQGKNW